MMKIRLLLCALLLVPSFMVAQRVSAQQKSAQHTKKDIRPLHGLDASKIPVIHSFEEFAKRQHPSSLTESAVYAGKLAYTPLQINKSETLVPEPSSQSGMAKVFWRVLYAPNGTVNWMWRLKTGGSEAPHVAA